MLLFPAEDEEGKEVYSVFCRAWLPEARVESQDRHDGRAYHVTCWRRAGADPVGHRA
jgi:hypothetical protein